MELLRDMFFAPVLGPPEAGRAGWCCWRVWTDSHISFIFYYPGFLVVMDLYDAMSGDPPATGTAHHLHGTRQCPALGAGLPNASALAHEYGTLGEPQCAGACCLALIEAKGAWWQEPHVVDLEAP